MINKIQKYILNNKLEISILLIILLVAAFFRLYRIADYMTFLGDEGRDAIVAKDILQGHFTLLGPRASAGDFFLGPIYYYMMAPFLLLTHLDPVGPAIMIALFGIATVFLVYYVGRKFINAEVGLIAASLYAISPLVIVYSRSSWNPNAMPFFSLLMLYLLYLAVKKGSHKLFVSTGFLLGIAMQLHYLSTFLAVIIFFFVLFGEYMTNKKDVLRRYLYHYLEILGGFLLGFSPFLAFESKHGFPNTRTILKFVFEDNTVRTYVPHHSFLVNIYDVFFRIFGRLVTKFPTPDQLVTIQPPVILLWQVATVILAIVSIISLFSIKEKLKVLFLSIWLFFGIFLFGVYKQNIYDYYFGFIFPLPFLLVGGFLSNLRKIKRLKSISTFLAVIIYISIVAVNLCGNPLLYTPNKQKAQAQNIAEYVLSKTNGQPFNFALMTDGNSDHLYRYFFEIENRAPVTILNLLADPDRKSVTSQLMIVCELKTCQPLGYSLWEVAGFGRAEIAGEWDVPHVKVMRLVHYHSSP